METDYYRAKRAIIYIEEHAAEQPTLDEVARHVGLSPYHFQRLFRRWAGISPKRFLQHVTSSRAKELLRRSKPVLDSAFQVGLSGSGRLHDLIVTTDAVTPGEYKTGGVGLHIGYGVHETPFGWSLVGATDRGVCALRFLDGPEAGSAVTELEDEWSGATLVHAPDSTRPLVDRIFAAHGTSPEPFPLLLKGTNFQIKVWEGLLRVPEGCLVSYGDLAARLEVGSSTRAGARAVGANPIA
jgi:AraC family transcriptional regulator of adaptative response/methylated-DNA-[protein]-cysteine methyltransferase